MGSLGTPCDELGPQATQLLDTIISRVRDRYGINLDDRVFMSRFGLHLRHLLERADLGVVLPGRTSLRIKDEHPFLDLMARYVAALVEESTSAPLPEAEVSYIALHLGVQIERQKADFSHVTYVLVAHEYLEMSDIVIDACARRTPTQGASVSWPTTTMSGPDVDLVVSLLRSVERRGPSCRPCTASIPTDAAMRR